MGIDLNSITSDPFEAIRSLSPELSKRLTLRLRENNIITSFRNYMRTLAGLLHSLFLVFGVKRSNEAILRKYEEELGNYLPEFNKSIPKGLGPSEYFDNILRNYHAARIMLQAMNKYNQKIGIVVFGIGHTDGLIQEFLKQTNNNINIIVVR